MKWVRASERLPDTKEKMQIVHYRFFDNTCSVPFRSVSVSQSFGNTWLRFWTSIHDIKSYTAPEIEWLDESPEPQQGNESKNGYTITLFYVDGKPSTFTDSRCNNKK